MVACGLRLILGRNGRTSSSHVNTWPQRMRVRESCMSPIGRCSPKCPASHIQSPLAANAQPSPFWSWVHPACRTLASCLSSTQVSLTASGCAAWSGAHRGPHAASPSPASRQKAAACCRCAPAAPHRRAALLARPAHSTACRHASSGATIDMQPSALQAGTGRVALRAARESVRPLAASAAAGPEHASAAHPAREARTAWPSSHPSLPLRRAHQVQRVVDHLGFHQPVRARARRQRRRRVDLNQPGPQIRVDDYVIAVQLEAVAVVDHSVLARLERL